MPSDHDLSDVSTEELLDMYWAMAYREGREQRNHDTEGGETQAVLSELRSRFMPEQHPHSVLIIFPKSVTDLMETAYANPQDGMKIAGQLMSNTLSNISGILRAKIELESTGPLSMSQNEARLMYTSNHSIEAGIQ